MRRDHENLTPEELADIRREHRERLETGGFIPLSSAETGPERIGQRLREKERRDEARRK
jgi:hypothetical protein